MSSGKGLAVLVAIEFLSVVGGNRSFAGMNFCIGGVGTLPPPTPTVCDNNLFVLPPQYLPAGPNGDFNPTLGAIGYNFIEGSFSSSGTATSPSDIPGATPAFGLSVPSAAPPPPVANPGGAFTGLAHLTALVPGSFIVQASDVYTVPVLQNVNLKATLTGFAFFPTPSFSAITNIQLNAQVGLLTNNFNFNVSPYILSTNVLSPGAAPLGNGVVVPFTMTNVVTGNVSNVAGSLTEIVSIQPTVLGSGVAIYLPTSAEVTISGRPTSNVDNSAILGLAPSGGFPFPGNGGGPDKPGGVDKPPVVPPVMKNDAPAPKQAHLVVINESTIEGLASVFVDGMAVPVTFSQFSLPFATVPGQATLFTDIPSGATDMGDFLLFAPSGAGSLVRFSSDGFDPPSPAEQEVYFANGPDGSVLYEVNSPQEVREPGALVPLGTGILVLTAVRRRRRRGD